jgi:hypothetical protein
MCKQPDASSMSKSKNASSLSPPGSWRKHQSSQSLAKRLQAFLNLSE